MLISTKRPVSTRRKAVKLKTIERPKQFIPKGKPVWAVPAPKLKEAPEDIDAMMREELRREKEIETKAQKGRRKKIAEKVLSTTAQYAIPYLARKGLEHFANVRESDMPKHTKQEYRQFTRSLGQLAGDIASEYGAPYVSKYFGFGMNRLDSNHPSGLWFAPPRELTYRLEFQNAYYK